MQNNQKTTTDDQQKNQGNQYETKLCEICKTLFGTAATNYYCSQCYKTLIQVQTEDKQQQVQQQIVQEQQQQEQKTQIQEDSSKCKTCKRKLGISGIKCKCNSYFCNKHRLPEEHQCTFDHAEKARQQLIKNNPLVDHKKLEEL